MTAIIILTITMSLVVALTVRYVRRDGYGHRPPPRSHQPWGIDTWPSEPYRSLR